jgi:hypothetical protein
MELYISHHNRIPTSINNIIVNPAVNVVLCLDSVELLGFSTSVGVVTLVVVVVEVVVMVVVVLDDDDVAVIGGNVFGNVLADDEVGRLM